MIGRKLNSRLAELKMQSKETMSKLQLQNLFEHERDKELKRLEKISDSAKIFGRAGDVVEMELDLEVGWAYQLLAKFEELAQAYARSGDRAMPRSAGLANGSRKVRRTTATAWVEAT